MEINRNKSNGSMTLEKSPKWVTSKEIVMAISA
jgi:hypothetical protein